MRVRSMVGLIPLFAVETIEEPALERFPAFVKRAQWFISNRPEFAGSMDAMTSAARASGGSSSSSIAIGWRASSRASSTRPSSSRRTACARSRAST